ncbi:sensor histidine kinase [Tunicatimonas pelagia]|uniref:sensor histidine kinase n=1 Tax=Tunicatimonas pelagia TaxID=931531 RepID=UPI002667084A|nr:sensor histidine kinase [Tunicatimonas pelagia]WKN43766.1 PAS domain S-box protein [Tunicatimonas pelagia]
MITKRSTSQSVQSGSPAAGSPAAGSPATESQQADEEIENNEMFRLAMEHSAIGLALISPDGHWLKVNQALCDIVGYTEKELLKIDFQTITHPDDLEDDLELIHRLLAGDIETYTIKKRYFHKNRTIIWIKLTASIVRDEYYQPLYFIAQIQDQTEEHQNQEKLRRTNKELERLTSQISHDVRSPLESSIRVLSLTKRAFERDDIAGAKETVNIVENQLEKLRALVDDILAITKARHQEEPISEVNFAAIVGDALEKFSHMDNFERIVFHQKFDYRRSFKTQPGRIISIVENLLSNAIKYQDPSEEDPQIAIHCFEKEGYILFQISDNGLGIDEKYYHKMFRMFQRFHAINALGSGIGLYLVRQNAEALGGTVEFIPRTKGCCFVLSIPKLK